MSCGCNNTELLDVHINWCDTDSELDLTAEATERLYAVLEFAGYEIPFTVDTVEGENIRIPNKFINETANHVLRLYKANGTLLNGVCYKLILTYIPPDGPVVIDGVFELQFESQFE
jgi:hypothetical protein